MQTVEGGEGAGGRAKQLLQQKKARDHAKVPKPTARWQSRQEMERIAKEKQARGARRFRSGVGPRANITSRRETQGGGREGGRKGDWSSGSGDRGGGGGGGSGNSGGGGDAAGEDDAYVAMREEQMKQQQRGRGGGGVRVGGGGEEGGSYGYSIGQGDDDGNDDDYGDFFDDDDGSGDDDGGWIKSPLQTSRLDVLVDHRRSTGGDGDGDGDGNRSGSTASSLSLPPCRTSTSTTQYHKYASVVDPRQTSSGLGPRTPSGHHTRAQRTELGDMVVRLKVVRDTCSVAHTARASKLEAALAGVFTFYCRDVRLDGQPRRDLDHMKVRGVGTRQTGFSREEVW